MPNEQDQQLTAGGAATTEKSGTADDAAGKADPTVAGLSARLTKEIEGRKADKQALAEALSKLGDEEDGRTKLSRMERENIALRKSIQYPDVATTLQKAFDKGLDPSLVDDEFIESFRALRTNGGTPAPKSESDNETPPHNPVRSTSPVSAMEQLKGMSWPTE